MALRSCFLTAFSAWQDTLLDHFKSSQICSRLWFFGSLFFYRGSLLMLTTSHHILGSTGRSALMFCGGCCSSPVARELYKEILYSWCKYKFCVSHCFWELRVHLEKQWFLSKIWKKSVHILYVIWKILCFRYWAVQWVHRLCRDLPLGKEPRR